mmetsp:Transcript_34543/g.84631  ORF Transcript_34543/g.84631 Transcript_34543/m.84631 type:complete len:453 (-) Transcript_34543:147-1505(-)
MLARNDTVAVVGFGPVGALAAARIAQQRPDVTVHVLECASRAVRRRRDRPYYAAHLAQSAVSSLKRAGAWCDVRAAARTTYDVRYRVAGVEALAFDNSTLGNCLVPQRAVEDALYARCDALHNVHVHYDTRYVRAERCGRHVRVHAADGRTFDVAYLLACDGASSAVRADVALFDDGSSSSISDGSRGVRFDGVTRRQWCVVDVTLHNARAVVGSDMVWSVNKDWPGMYVSLSDNHVRFEYCCCPAAQAAVAAARGGVATGGNGFDCAVDDDGRELRAQMAAVAHFVPPPLLAAVIARGRMQRASVYRMHSRFASTCQDTRVSPRVLLLGDAARLIEPYTGQGVSNGFADVEYVVACIAHNDEDDGGGNASGGSSDKYSGDTSFCHGGDVAMSLDAYSRARRRAAARKHTVAAIVGYLLHMRSALLLLIAALVLRVLPRALTQRAVTAVMKL